MTRTFEELAGSEMDVLYQGALFLCAGDAEAAEDLVLDAVMLAFEEHAAEADPERTRRWFEARLVRSYLGRIRGLIPDDPHAPVDRMGVDPAAFDALGPDELFQAAAVLPPGARAALWLVLLRRWSHGDAAAAMKLTDDQMQMLLGYRDVLMQEMIGARGQRRTRGSS